MKKVLSIALSMVILISAIGLNVYANEGSVWDLTWDEWGEIWDENYSNRSAVTMNPGSDVTQMNFAWHSPLSSYNAVVKVSKSSDMTSSTVFAAKSTVSEFKEKINKATVTNLEPDTVYYYVCSSTNGYTTAPAYFKTGTIDNKFTALYYGDVHISASKLGQTPGEESLKESSYTWHNALTAGIKKFPDTSLILSAGDMATSAYDGEYMGLHVTPITQSIPSATCIGNHDKKNFYYDKYENNPNEFNSIAGSVIGSDYWFTRGNVLFLVYDSTNGSGLDHYNFTKNAVAKNPDAKWRIGLFHHDIYGGAYSNNSDNELLRMIFDPILDKFDVDIMLTGHGHFYGRTSALTRGEITTDLTGLSEVTDPDGTIFMVTTSVNNMTMDSYPTWNVRPETVVHDVNREPVYTALEVDGNSIRISSHHISDDSLLDEFTIHKSDSNNPKPADKIYMGLYSIIGLGGTIYTMVDKIINLFRLIGGNYGTV